MNTSHAAYLTVNTTELEEIVYQGILKAGMRGATSDELEVSLDMRNNILTPRFAPLERKGRIYRPGITRQAVSGRQQLVMYADKYEARVRKTLVWVRG